MTHYDVIFVGFPNSPRVGGSPANAIAEVFGIPPDAAERLVLRAPSIVKRAVSEKDAKRYHNAFRYIGAECAFRPVASEEPLRLDLASGDFDRLRPRVDTADPPSEFAPPDFPAQDTWAFEDTTPPSDPEADAPEAELLRLDTEADAEPRDEGTAEMQASVLNEFAQASERTLRDPPADAMEHRADDDFDDWDPWGKSGFDIDPRRQVSASRTPTPEEGTRLEAPQNHEELLARLERGPLSTQESAAPRASGAFRDVFGAQSAARLPPTGDHALVSEPSAQADAAPKGPGTRDDTPPVESERRSYVPPTRPGRSVSPRETGPIDGKSTHEHARPHLPARALGAAGAIATPARHRTVRGLPQQDDAGGATFTEPSVTEPSFTEPTTPARGNRVSRREDSGDES